MRKMKTLFKREFIKKGNRTIGIIVLNEVEDGCEWALNGVGTMSSKFDGTCCLVQGGELYKRFDYKKGRNLPSNAIPCQDAADKITGHFPHWVKCSEDNPADKWHLKAFKQVPHRDDGTYELCGEHFNGNKHRLKCDIFFRHGTQQIFDYELELTFEGIKDYLNNTWCEGIVFKHPDGTMCKIKRTDFGFDW